MAIFSLRKIRSIGIVTVQVLVLKSCTIHDIRGLVSQAGLLVLVLRVLEHGPNLGIPGQQQIKVNKANLSLKKTILLQGDHCQNETSMGSSSEGSSGIPSDSSLPTESLMETSPQPESLVRLMSQFGMRAKEAQVEGELFLRPIFLDQATDPKFWSSPCTVMEKDAVDAIRR